VIDGTAFMLHVNGQPHAVLTLFTGDCPEWLHDVSLYLSNQDYRSHLARSAEDAWNLIRLQHPDVLLAAADNADSFHMFQAIRENLHPDDQPLLVLVTNQPTFENIDTNADIIAVAHPISALEYQLRALIHLRTKNAHLRRENEHLRRELDLERQTSSGLELLKNAIVRNVAHELRTPLLQVKSAVALMAEDVGDMSTLIGLAQRATTRLEAGVQNITLLNELINEGLENRAFEAVVLKEVLDSAIRNLKRSWEHKDNVERIHAQMPHNLPPVLGDKLRLVISLQLLIDNALKFSQSQVDVIFRRVDNRIHIAVRDYGIGIPKDYIDKIFDTFYQIDNSSTKAYGGMGIGLAIVRFILERHNAVIEVETEIGKGSTFSFSLPIAEINDTS
jgi:signal transduction histidine kinase